MNGVLPAAIVVVIAAVTVLGDYFLKLASTQDSMIWNRWFLAGAVIYALCAFGWVFVMRHLKLATIGAAYSVSTVLLLTALGVLVFDERLDRYEVAGLCCAVLSIVLLARLGA